MTEPTDRSMNEVTAFYDRLASEYDDMTGFEQRFVKEKPFFRLIVEQHGISTAIDAGAGTGFHSLLLAQMGVDVTAVDVSGEMLARLAVHAAAMGVRIRTAQSSFQDLGTTLTGRYDAVFCMGNSLAHLLTVEDLRRSIGSFAGLLRPGGIMLIQILNYNRIMANREKIQSIREHNGTTFVRQYEYTENTIRFSVMRFRTSGAQREEAVNSITLRQIFAPELVTIAAESGFSGIRQYGSIAMEEFDPHTSRDLVVIGIRR